MTGGRRPTDHLVAPGDAAAMGEAGRKHVAFGAERFVADMDAMYRELLAAKPHRGRPLAS
jgi:hypothetical protein